MKPVRRAWMIQIDITTRCHLRCAHCTRGLRHLSKRGDASLEFIERALESLVGFPGLVGCIGGEPTLHKEFPEVCRLYRKYFPRWKCGLWTAGGPRWADYRELIDETFQVINYNDHSVPARHQPLFAAGRDIVADKAKRDRIIDRCWLQHEWAPAITQHGGAFFCEVAATMDHVLNEGLGWELEPGWWKRKGPGEQRKLCESCGIPYKIYGRLDTDPNESISESMVPVLEAAGSPVARRRTYTVVTETDREEARQKLRRWEPEKYVSKGPNYWTRRSWRMHARQHLLSIPYRVKRAIWELQGRFGG